jgi:ABC-type multidrug transport system fused ATPase/permease subunit
MVERSPLWRFFGFIKPHLALFGVTGLFVLLIRLFQLPPPLLYRSIVDQALPEGNVLQLGQMIATLAAVLLGARILGFFLHVLAAKLQQSILHDVRMTLCAHLQKLDLGFFKRHRVGGLLSRITSDVNRVQSIISRQTFEIFASLLQVIVVAGMLVWLNPELSLVSAVVFPLLIGLVVIFQKRLYNIAKTMQERREDLSAKIQENLAGTRLIQIMALEKQTLFATRATSTELKKTVVRSEAIGAGVNVLTIALTDLPLTLLVWGYGGYLVIKDELSLGSLLAFYQYLMMLYDPVIQILRFNIQLQMAKASVDRIYEILDTDPMIFDSEDAQPLRVEQGAILFDDVSLRYDPEGPDVVEGLSLEIKPGEVLGIVGPSGAGKTTIVNGLTRFLSPSAGRILIDGQDIESVTLSSLRKQIGLVAQDVFLFSDTLAANIALSDPDADDVRIRKAARAAQVHGFASQQKDGYDTVVGERGLGLSEGERQRIALARMIFKAPPILVFDEATSSLDAQSEELIQNALEEIVKGRTTIIIAHRFSTLKLCHRIAVLSGGQLIELGTMDTLKNRGGLFQTLLETQQLGLEA